MDEIKQQIKEALAKHGINVDIDVNDELIAEKLLFALTRPNIESVTLDDKNGLQVNYYSIEDNTK